MKTARKTTWEIIACAAVTAAIWLFGQNRIEWAVVKYIGRGRLPFPTDWTPHDHRCTVCDFVWTHVRAAGRALEARLPGEGYRRMHACPRCSGSVVWAHDRPRTFGGPV